MKVYYLFLCLIGFIIFSCSWPGTGGQPGTTPPLLPTAEPTPESEITPPESVEADFVDDVPRVSWSAVKQADAYDIFRQNGVGEYLLTGTVDAARLSYDDPDFPRDVSFNYTIRSRYGYHHSTPSNPSNNLSKYIQGLEASILEYTDKIVVSWKEAYRAQRYTIYRYEYKNEEPVIIGETTSPYFEDTNCEKNILYYYRVTWMRNNREYGTGGPFIHGICSGYVDYYEPNDSICDIEDQQSSTLFIPGQPPYTFSFYDNVSETTIDTDWYKYTGPPRMIFVKVAVPFDSVFSENELFFRFSYNNALSPEQPVYAEWTDIRKREWGRTFIFDNVDPRAEVMELYYTLYPLLPTTIHKFGSYRIEISDEL